MIPLNLANKFIATECMGFLRAHIN